MLQIHRLPTNSPDDENAWDQFVRSSPNGTVFHLSAWKKAGEKVFRHTPHYLMAMSGNEIRVVLPLFEIHGLLSGRIMVSVPYAVYGGLCGTDAVARQALLEEARQLAMHQRVRHVELRHLSDAEPDLQTKSLYATFIKPIDPNPDTNLEAIPRKQRRMVRQGIKHGLETRYATIHRNLEALATSSDKMARPDTDSLVTARLGQYLSL